MGKDKALPIKHTGTVTIQTALCPLILNDVLHVPDLKKNLLSISQFTRDHSCVFHFDSICFTVTNRNDGRLIAKGRRYGNLYSLDQIKNIALFSNRQREATSSTWHCRLGHCASRILSQLHKQKQIDVKGQKSDSPSVCTSYKIA